MNFEDIEKNREEEIRKAAEEEKKQRYNENKRSFREAKRHSVVHQVQMLLPTCLYFYNVMLLPLRCYSYHVMYLMFDIRTRRRSPQRRCW